MALSKELYKLNTLRNTELLNELLNLGFVKSQTVTGFKHYPIEVYHSNEDEDFIIVEGFYFGSKRQFKQEDTQEILAHVNEQLEEKNRKIRDNEYANELAKEVANEMIQHDLVDAFDSLHMVERYDYVSAIIIKIGKPTYSQEFINSFEFEQMVWNHIHDKLDEE